MKLKKGNQNQQYKQQNEPQYVKFEYQDTNEKIIYDIQGERRDESEK